MSKPSATDPPSPTTLDLLALGDLTWDVLAKPKTLLLPGGDTTGQVLLSAGGSSANLAVWAARVGAASGIRVGFLGKVGRDDLGALAAKALLAEGIRDHIVWSEAVPTSVVLVLIDQSGQRAMLTNQGADFFLLPSEVAPPVVASARHLHITAWSLFTDPPRGAALEAARLAQAAGASISFDPGSYQMIREIGREEFRRLTRELRPTIVLPNLEEGRALTGAEQPQAVAEALQDLYPGALVVLKLDRDGALIADGGSHLRVAASADQAIDATGAGDAFAGAFLGHYLRWHNAQAAAQLAVQVAGWVVGQLGARPAGNADLAARLAAFAGGMI
jgi:ribokinase